jgi:hypothetical protein
MDFIVDINTILISLTPFSCHLRYHSSELKSSIDIQIAIFLSSSLGTRFALSDVNETLCYANYVANERNLIYFSFFSASRVLCSSARLYYLHGNIIKIHENYSFWETSERNNTWNSFPKKKDKFNFFRHSAKSWRKKLIFIFFFHCCLFLACPSDRLEGIKR